MHQVQAETPLDETKALRDISVTERADFRACRRRWYLSTIENLEPKRPDLALEFGKGIHTALEVYFEKGSFKKVLEALTDHQDETAVRWDTAPEELLIERDELYSLGLDMLDNYRKFDKDSKVQLGKVLAIEGRLLRKNPYSEGNDDYPPEAQVKVHESGRLLVPIVDPATHMPIMREGRVVNLSARLDMITERETPSKGLWVVDHKSQGSASQDKGLDFDDQVTGYDYTLWRWLGEIPRGVIYDILVKQGVEPPREIKKERYGSNLSTAKDQLTTPDLYFKVLKEKGLLVPGTNRPVAEPYEECLDALIARGWDPFFRRYETTRNWHELKSFEEHLFQEYEDMEEAHGDEARRYPNRSTFWCPRCAMNRICLAMDDGSDWVFIAESEYQQKEDRKA